MSTYRKILSVLLSISASGLRCNRFNNYPKIQIMSYSLKYFLFRLYQNISDFSLKTVILLCKFMTWNFEKF